jgi:hypothetical protein
MNKTAFILILFFAIILITLQLYAQDNNSRSNINSENELAYSENEELVYAANYTWGPIWTDVGEIALKIRRIIGEPIRYYVRGDAHTYKFYDNFFKVRDIYEASFEVPHIYPVHFYRDIHEGNYNIKNIYRFYKIKNCINITIQQQKSPARDTIIDIKQCTFDVLTFFYHSRNLDFSNVMPNQVFRMNVVIDD